MYWAFPIMHHPAPSILSILLRGFLWTLAAAAWLQNWLCHLFSLACLVMGRRLCFATNWHGSARCNIIRQQFAIICLIETSGNPLRPVLFWGVGLIWAENSERAAGQWWADQLSTVMHGLGGGRPTPRWPPGNVGGGERRFTHKGVGTT